MASSKEYLQYILEQLSDVEGISFKQMMGEYIIYCNGKIIGGIYDNRFLVKPVESAKAIISTLIYEKPYEGAKEMLLVEETDNKVFLKNLIESMYYELPEPKKQKKKK